MDREDSVWGKAWSRRALGIAGAFLACTLLPRLALAGGGGGHGIISDIALCMVAASVMGLLVKVLRQPLILGYIVAGVVIGPIGFAFIEDNAAIKTVAEIGLVLLLFMIGLEIDLRKMLAAGRLVIVTGAVQLPICVAVGFAAFWGMSQGGINFGEGEFAILYCAIAISISSTMIVVKLLFDKMELDTLPGRITVGILVFQDLWAIIILIIQPNLADPAIGQIALTFAKGALLVTAALMTSKYVLPIVFKSSAKLPELMLVISLGWCFLVALVAAHPKVGLSMEMGALIAGVSLATFPYNLDVIAKVISIRDFFITLFFVALGMQIPMPELDVITTAAIIAAVAIGARVFGMFGVLYALRGGHRLSLLTTINLSQVSEFSLVILTLGVSFGHITQTTLTYVIWVFAILAVASTYFVTYSHPLQGAFSRFLKAVGIKDIGGDKQDDERGEAKPVVMLGFFRIASAFLDDVRRNHPDLLREIMVVDFNPEVHAKLNAMGVSVVYGDVANQETLHHANIHDAKVAICTIPDFVLKGTTNKKLLSQLRTLCPHAKVVVTADSSSQATQLYDAGADFVLQPSVLAGANAITAAEAALADSLKSLREAAVAELGERNEVLA